MVTRGAHFRGSDRMTIWRLVASMILVCLSPLLAVRGSVDSHAQDSRVEIPVSMTDVSVSVGEPWRQMPDLSVKDSEREIHVLAGTNDNMVIGYVAVESASGDPVSDVLKQYSESIGALTDIDINSRYSLQAAEIGGVPYGMFSLIYMNRNPGVVEVHIYLAPASTFASGLASVQNSVMTNQKPVFFRVNGRTLESLVIRTAGPGDPATDASLASPLQLAPVVETPAPEPVVDPEVTPTLEPVQIAETELVPDGDESVDVEQAVPAAPESGSGVAESTPMVVLATPAMPLERPDTDVSMYLEDGVVEDGFYVSPQFDTEVRWDARWTVLNTDDASAVTSNGLTRTDSLSLMSTVYPDVVVVISFMSAYDFGMDDWRTALAIRDQNEFPDLYTDMNVSSGVAVLESRDGGTVFAFDVSTSEDGSVFREAEIQSIDSVAPEAIEAALGSISLDGVPIFEEITPDTLGTIFP